MKSPIISLISGLIIFSFSIPVFSQEGVGIGTESPNPNAVLELVSPGNNQGFLVPRLTTIQRTSINGLTNSDNGLLVFDSDLNQFFYWHSGQWNTITTSGGTALAAGNGIQIEDGTITNTGDTDNENEIQDLELTGNTLRITKNDAATAIDLSPFAGANTDQQTLLLTGDQLTITGGNTVSLASLDTDNSNEIQDLTLVGNTLTITNKTNPTEIDLAPFAGTNTDNQTLNLSGSTLSIVGGNSVDIGSSFPANLPPSGTAGGDLSGSYPNPTVRTSVIDSRIGNSDLNDLNNVNASPSTNQVLKWNGSQWVAGNDELGSGAPTLNSGQILTGNGTTNTGVTLGGDVNFNSSSGSITLKNNIVDSNNILDGTIVAGDIANGQITDPKLGNNSVNSSKISNGSIIDNDINASANISASKLSNTVVVEGENVSLLNNDAGYLVNADIPTNLPPSGTAGGDLTGNYPNPSINPAVIDSRIGSSELNDLSNVNASPASNQVLKWNGSQWVAGTDDTGTGAPQLNSGEILAGNGSTNFGIGVGGDLSLNSSTGNFTLNNNSVESVNIVDATIETADYGNGSITNSKLANNSVTSAKISNNSITDNDINGSANIAASKLENTVIVEGEDIGLLNNDVGYLLSADLPTTLPPNGAAGGDLTGNYPNPTVANNAITSAKIQNGAVSSADIADNNIINADVRANAAIAGTKISPNFGTQDVTTTGLGSFETLKMGTSSSSGQVLTAADANGNVVWQDLPAGLGGSGAANRMTYWTSASNLGSSNLYYTNATSRLGIGGANPRAPLHILNSNSNTSGTDGVFIDIQNLNGSPGTLSGIRFKSNATNSSNSYKAAIFFERGGLDANAVGFGDLVFAVNQADNTTNVSMANELLRLSPFRADFSTNFIYTTGNVDMQGSLQVDNRATIGAPFGESGNRLFVEVPSGNTTEDTGLKVENNYGGSNFSKSGIEILVSTAGTGFKQGINGTVLGASSEAIFGSNFSVQGNGLGEQYGHLVNIPTKGGGTRYGYVAQLNSGTGITNPSYGFFSAIDHDGAANTYGLYAVSSGTTSGIQYGVYTTGEDFNYFEGKIQNRLQLKQNTNANAGINGYYIEASGSTRYWKYFTSGTFLRFSYFDGTTLTHPVYYQPGGADWTIVSDFNTKKDIEKIDNILGNVLLLDPVYYRYKDVIDQDNYKNVGFIAQEVEPLFPELVTFPNEENQNYGLKYSGFGVLAIQAIKEQQEIIEDLKNQVVQNEQDIQRLIDRIEQLENKTNN